MSDSEQTVDDHGDVFVIRCTKCRTTWEMDADGTEDYKYSACPRCWFAERGTETCGNCKWWTRHSGRVSSGDCNELDISTVPDWGCHSFERRPEGA